MTTQTRTLADFLLARIAEDEEYVRTWADLDRADGDRLEAEVAAKRQIVEAYRGLRELASNLHYEGRSGEADTARAMYAGVELTLKAIGLVYATHPDFREEWRP